MGKFVVFTNENGMRFHLRAGNGETIATSEVYTTMASCRSGMESIRKCAPKPKLEDLLAEKKTAVSNPKFQIFLDKGGAYRFRLRARFVAAAYCKSSSHHQKKNFSHKIVVKSFFCPQSYRIHTPCQVHSGSFLERILL